MAKLAEMMRARFPYIYMTTWEEERAVAMISATAKNADIIKTPRKVYIWAQTTGFTFGGKSVDSATVQPLPAIDFIARSPDHAVFILKDFHVYFGGQNRAPEAIVVRKLRDIIPELRMSLAKKNVIFISPTLIIPDDIQKEVSVFDFPLPNIEEIRSKLEELIHHNRKIITNLNAEEKEKLSKAALGLTLQEAENAFARAMVSDGRLCMQDLAIIFEEKNQVIKKTGILEFVESKLNIDDVGGLENIKKWLLKRNNTWLDSAKKYNVSAPKGALITGVPGCGKSLTAKAISSMWQLPLLKLDMGKIFSSYVGSSEENMRRAIKTAEAVAPSILWVDEIEKGFGGINSTGDSGTSARIFGTFLTWMQDKTAPVFVIATANNISMLPPELLRKGRFDEIFFVDLPTHSERQDIFRLHLSKRLRNEEVARDLPITDELFSDLADLTEGFSGAEIEQTVISALYEAFFEERPLLMSDLEGVIKTTVPLSVTQKEQIKGLRDWANLRAVSATPKSDKLEYATETMNNEEIGSSRGGRDIDF